MLFEIVVQKFWSRVNKSTPESCWNWTAAKQPGRWGGYGVIRVANEEYPGNMLAHRLSWIIHNGPIPDGLWVLHHCDNPSCVNPSHLWLGDNDDNMDDMNKKGRHGGPRGEQVPFAKLTCDKVSEIYKSFWERRKEWGIVTRLARNHGVTRDCIYSIIKRECWRHVTDKLSNIPTFPLRKKTAGAFRPLPPCTDPLTEAK